MQGYPYYSFTSFILGTELCVPNLPISIVMEISTSISGYFFFQLNALNLGIELNSFRAISDHPNGWALNSSCVFLIKCSILSVKFAWMDFFNRSIFSRLLA